MGGRAPSLIHPDLYAMIAIARRAGIAVHITTRFSYNFTRARIDRLVDSGLSHLTVAVDGATQESYGATRIRGNLAHVLSNLAMVEASKRERGLEHPFVEIQHLRFAHHPPGELEKVRQIAAEPGADKFMTYRGVHRNARGELYNVVDDDPEATGTGSPLGAQLLPRCHWPYSSTVIRYDGEVLPCCLRRAGRQYAPGADSRSLGNVFDRPLAEIWNGPAYRGLRRTVSDPVSKGTTGSFCDGCPKICASPEAALCVHS
ncbi:SPASM domain-containing protein [Sphingomonas cavernae]|uniref:4Fe4S-binding SPASM domain-containing protein n=1 Tax=Sphingomonas cavernae TaxID=2320861 RepID=A0A418WKY5_9SPHN|nr:SPASM domain-containing protein [Sphingomonas cavernae]RJF90706.1 hypothetical protein D3876_10890 [Sphingomonas cavernae]